MINRILLFLLLFTAGSAWAQAPTRLIYSQQSATSANDQILTAELGGGFPATSTMRLSDASQFTQPNDLAFDAVNNYLFVVDNASGAGILRYTYARSTGALSNRTVVVAGTTSATYQGVALDVANGRLYFTQSSATSALDAIKVAEGVNAGTISAAITPTELTNGGSGSFSNLNDIVYNATNQQLYVADAVNSGGGILRYTLSANGVSISAGPTSLIGGTGVTGLTYTGLALDAANNRLYFAQSIAGSTSTADDAVKYLSTSSPFTVTTLVTGSGSNFYAPSDLAIDLAGQYLYVADQGNPGTNSILRFQLDGTATTAQATLTTVVSGSTAGAYSGVALDGGSTAATTSVSSITRASANPTNAATVQYTVTFAASVTGLTASNFNLTTTGSFTTAPSVGTISGSGTTYTVPVNTGSGDGTLRLNLNNATSLTPSVSNVPYTSGDVYTIDKTAPAVTSISSTAGASGTTTNTTPIPFTVTFSENVTGFVQGDLSVTNGTVSGFTAASGTTYTFNVTPTTAGTATTVNVAAGVVQDAAGNTNTAAPAAFSITYNVPAVTVSSVTRLSLSPTALASVTYQIIFSGSVSGVSSSNFAVTNTSSSISGTAVTGVSGSGTTYTVTVGTGTGNGTLRLDVVNSTNISPSVTNVPYTTGEEYTITKNFAAAPTLRIQAAGSASGNGDVTAFVDVVQVLQSGTSNAVANGLQNGSFETNNVPANGFKKTADGVVAAPWSFNDLSGVALTGSGFSPPTPPNGDAVALVQSAGNNNASISQNLAVPTGSYQINFQTAQRNYTARDQRLNVFVNDVFVGSIQPVVYTSYEPFTSATFNVTAPALTATVSTTSTSPTSTAPIPFSVTFSQSVGSTFVASDVTVAGGTVTSGSFSGSGAGPYTFTVTPNGAGTVSVSLAAGVATDANNTGNSASNSVSVQFQAPTITISPSSLLNGQQGTAYSQPLSATGGTAPYTYTITAGALPSGLSLSSNGTIAGTPTTNGTFNFTVTARDASPAPGPYSGSRNYSLFISTQPVTAAPVVTTPTNASQTKNPQPTYSGTAPANSTVTVYVGLSAGTASAIGTTTATAGGAFSLAQPTALADGVYQVYATAQTSGSAVSANSNTNSFTVDTTAPTVTLSSGTVTSGGTTSTSPVSFTATFSEAVTGFSSAGLTVSNGTVTSGPTAGANNTYTFQVTPSAAGTVTVRVAAGAAQDQATNGNTASALFSLTFVAPTIAVGPNALNNGQQGVAYSQALSASGGTAPYSYAITAGVLPSGLSLSSSGTIAGTPTTNGTFNFTVTATDASTAPGPYSGSRNYSLTITAPAITATTWTGAISTDWFTTGNWTQGQPDATIDATIPGAPSGGRFPAISAGPANVRNLTLNSGSTLTQSGGTLIIAANLTNNGTFLPTDGTVVLGNTTASNVFGSSNIRFWNLTVGSSGAQLSTSIGASVRRLLTLNGNFATNGYSFVLESNNTLTALVVNNGSSVVNGTVTVQRAIDPSVNSGLGYRHYSAPVSNSTVGDLAASGFTPVVNPTYNTSATPDAVIPFPTVFGYDDSRLSLTNSLSSFDKGYFSPAALSDPLAVGKGYTVNIAANEVVDFQGTLNNGNLSLNLTSTRNTYPTDGGWQFLGNPYPAPLDYSQVAAADRNGLEGAIYIYSSTSQYQGRYRVYINGIGNPVVPLGQGYFARVASGNTTANMTFRNSQRLTAPDGTTLQRPAADPRPLVQLTLQGQGAAPADEAYVYFENGATSNFEPAFDAEKLPNPTGFNLSTTQAGKQLSVDGQPALGTTQRVVPLAVGVPAAGSYTLAAAQLLNLSQVPVYLRDKQTGALIDLAQQRSYSFSVGSAATLVQGRFELVFSPQQVLAATPAALAEQVGLYPNPATSQVAIELPATLGRQAVTVSLVDAVGRTVRTQVLRAGLASHTLPLHELATGVYSLRFHTEAGVLVKKLVIE